MKTLQKLLLGLALAGLITGASAQNITSAGAQSVSLEHATGNVMPAGAEIINVAAGDSVQNNLTGTAEIYSVAINRAYPNPVISDFQLDVSCGAETPATLKLIDLTGHTAMERPVKLVNGNNHFEINMDDLSGGVYQLIVQTDTKRIGYKLVKSR